MAVGTKEILSEIKNDLKDVRQTQTLLLQVTERQQAILDEHMRRSEANEKAVEVLRAELSPLKTHAAVWGAAAKVLAAMGAIVSVVVGVVKVVSMLGG